jgi:hypothetical protein
MGAHYQEAPAEPSMAAIRGFSLAKIAKIRVAFNTFDTRIVSARYSDLSAFILGNISSLCLQLYSEFLSAGNFCAEYQHPV